MLKDFYAVFRCLHSEELHGVALDADFAVWVPIEKIMIIHKDKAMGVTEIKRCALTGYIFVRFDQWVAFRRWCPGKYMPRLLTMPTAAVGSPDEVWLASRFPCKVPRSALEAVVIKLSENKEPRKFTVGEKLKISAGVFCGMTCVYMRAREGRMCRVRIEGNGLLSSACVNISIDLLERNILPPPALAPNIVGAEPMSHGGGAGSASG